MKKMSSFSSLFVHLIAVTVLLASKNYAQDPNFYVFLAFGQSNMQGWDGNGVNQIEQQDRDVPDRFQTLPAVDWPHGSRKKGIWTKAVPPLCRNTTGLSPCDYFGRRLVESLPDSIKIGIINVAVAGCKIEMFDKAKYKGYISSEAGWMQDIYKLYGENPYGRLVDMGKLAQKDGVIKGFLLHQGESGAMKGNNWADEVAKIYTDLIADLGLDAKKVPLIAGGLTADGKENRNASLPWDLVKSEMASYNFHVASSIGCAANMNDGFDGLHFSGPGYRELGKHYADTMLTILKKQATAIAEGNKKAAVLPREQVQLHATGNGVTFKLSENAPVTVKLYTLGGREIATLAAGEYTTGEHTISLRNGMQTAGVCMVKLTAGRFSATRTIISSSR